MLKSGRTYSPKSTVAAQHAVAQAALAARSTLPTPAPFEGAVRVGIQACFPYPKATSKAKRVDWSPMPQRPDVDNLTKTVLDGCNGILFADDSQVVSLTIEKFRVTGPDDVGMFVEVGVL